MNWTLVTLSIHNSYFIIHNFSAGTDSRVNLFGCLFLAGHRLALALTSARIVLGALTTNRQTFAVTQATVAANIHQSLDVELNLRAQHAFGFVLPGDDVTDIGRFRFRPILDLFVDVNASFNQDFGGVGPANAKNVSQGDFAALVVRDINPCDTSHCE